MKFKHRSYVWGANWKPFSSCTPLIPVYSAVVSAAHWTFPIVHATKNFFTKQQGYNACAIAHSRFDMDCQWWFCTQTGVNSTQWLEELLMQKEWTVQLRNDYYGGYCIMLGFNKHDHCAIISIWMVLSADL